MHRRGVWSTPRPSKGQLRSLDLSRLRIVKRRAEAIVAILDLALDSLSVRFRTNSLWPNSGIPRHSSWSRLAATCFSVDLSSKVLYGYKLHIFPSQVEHSVFETLIIQDNYHAHTVGAIHISNSTWFAQAVDCSAWVIRLHNILMKRKVDKVLFRMHHTSTFKAHRKD